MVVPYKVGQKFYSKDKLGKELKFIIISVEPAKSELYNNWYYMQIISFKLNNKWLSPEEYKFVNAINCDLYHIITNHIEQEWFNQRIIKEILK